ncbi:LysR substrate-binding domain-containing protein [Luteimonas sp. SDU101]|uniref:LysR substrate-binding domain-containing protein n=1 Tax=Luteimonas sp. SDU101 TaxID=3422593 RepID=UPI003EBB0E38
MQEAAADIAARGAVRTVTISTTIGFTVLWLMPRLGGFQSRHPQLDVRISAHNQVMDLRHGDIDLAVRYTTAEQAPPGATLLFEETVVPVASPTLRLGRLRGGRIPGSITLLEFEERYPWLRWQHWLGPGDDDARPRRVLHFNQYGFGVNLTTLLPGAMSALRHHHSRQDEFIYVLEGHPVLVTDAGRTQLSPGMCAGFRAGDGNGHHLLNPSAAPVLYLEVGDRSEDDVVGYPDDDLVAVRDGGRWRFAHRDGTPW